MNIGILYICTGPYVLFWEDFYKSFEKNFLPNTEKKYYVFTDSDKEGVYASDEKNVNVIKIDNLPWPLITLLRFNTFLKIEEQLKKCDYLMFSNANIICNNTINESEFLPQLNEQLFVTCHPGYYGKKKICFPYDRNKKCLAYIPWNCGKVYVIGAMFGGTSKAFLEMTHELNYKINEDLKKNIIAKWHDESHLNRYIVGREDVKILEPEYCYPYGMNVTYEAKLSAVSKQEKFDVKTFKGNYENNKNVIFSLYEKIKGKLMIKEHFGYLKDFILGKKI